MIVGLIFNSVIVSNTKPVLGITLAQTHNLRIFGVYTKYQKTSLIFDKCFLN